MHGTQNCLKNIILYKILISLNFIRYSVEFIKFISVQDNNYATCKHTENNFCHF